MKNRADWLTAREMEEIAAILRHLYSVGEEHVTLGEIPVNDPNGEPLGFIEIKEGEPHFVPAGWRAD